MTIFKKKDRYDYIRAFDDMSKYSIDAAGFLHRILKNFDKESLEEQVVKMHEIEKAADMKKKEMLENLISEFLPPIDKSDIIDLSHKIDDVTDEIEEVLVAIYTFNICEIRQEALKFSEMILEACENMNLCLVELQNYKKSKTIFDYISKVNSVKSKAEVIYKTSISNLYKMEQDQFPIYEYTEVYKKMRRCYLYCKMVTNTVEQIVVKYL
ncbi:DUF47 domain-containing protein [Alkalibacter saccharofermentans]|uniref:Phosphate transport regulator (Distant homolog of PhoU) n=1 Tax=Alkalibacter saccharofermentans DSM 14828 TaxID=1120975 RepID=A0A1M4UQ10_9FIRM|nr:DUF47 family protein [Alkalibacter saccharofermentans]SHE58683.1 hypothetical protein SAMN02746064_00785 [Alkalibacter saccharofermentans DSM 14828]